MVRVGPDRRVAGRAFVPVGRGHAPEVAFPIGGVMVLGQDFGNERNLDDVVAAGEETDAVPTWREIGKALRAEDIPIEACWFTNYVMGVRPGHESNCRGRSPGLRHGGGLRRACADLFSRQLRTQRPCAVVVLGTYLPPVLAADVPHIFAPWAARSFPLRDAGDNAVIWNAAAGGVTIPVIVSIVHPSLRGPNMAARRFQGRAGAEAERSLLRLVRDVVSKRWKPPQSKR